MRRRVVITGMGALTPLGHTPEQLYRNQLEGRSGVGFISLFNAQRFPTKIAGQVKDFDLGKYVSNKDKWADSGANTRFALAAARQALEDAELLESTGVDRTRFGIYMGTGEGIQDFQHLVSQVAQASPTGGKVDVPSFSAGAMRSFHRGREYEQELHTTTAHLAKHFDLEGPNL